MMRKAIKSGRILFILLVLLAVGGIVEAQCSVNTLQFTADGTRHPDGAVICTPFNQLGVAVSLNGTDFQNINCEDNISVDISFQWSTGDINSCIDPLPNNPILSQYGVTVTCDETGTEIDNLTITVLDIPDFDIVVSDCEDGQVTLTAEGIENIQELDFQWRVGGVDIQNSDRNNITVTLPGSGMVTYDVTVGYQESCEKSAVIEINSSDFSHDLTVTQSATMTCAGTTVRVTAESESGSVTGFSWERTTVPLETGEFIGDVADLGPGTYTITTIGDGCTAMEDITITEMPGPDPPELMGDVPSSLCEGETATVSITVIAGLSYSWRELDSTEVSTGSSFAVGPGALEIFAINGDGCTSAPRRINVGELNGHTPGITASPGEPYCEGDLITLTATNLRGATATWSTMEVGPSIMIESGGEYSVSYEGGELCPAATTRIIPDFGQPPSLPIQPDASALSGNATSLQLNLGNAFRVRVPTDSIETQNATVSQVSVINGGLLFFEPSGTAGARSTGAIRFTLIPESEEGCAGPAQTLLVRVVPDVEEPFIPEIISPNGDGSNDEWAVVFPEDGSGYDVVVYSRGGAVVFEGTGSQMPWDAGPCPNGVYYYRITQRGPEGGSWQGALTIIGRQ